MGAGGGHRKGARKTTHRKSMHWHFVKCVNTHYRLREFRLSLISGTQPLCGLFLHSVFLHPGEHKCPEDAKVGMEGLNFARKDWKKEEQMRKRMPWNLLLYTCIYVSRRSTQERDAGMTNRQSG